MTRRCCSEHRRLEPEKDDGTVTTILPSAGIGNLLLNDTVMMGGRYLR